jgi:small subunit ribosomal protein S4
MAASRPAARQLVSHKHITVNGEVVNVPSFSLRPGDVVGYKDKAIDNASIMGQARGKNPKINWLEWNDSEKEGTFIARPERDSVPENIREQLIVELYSK